MNETLNTSSKISKSQKQPNKFSKIKAISNKKNIKTNIENSSSTKQPLVGKSLVGIQENLKATGSINRVNTSLSNTVVKSKTNSAYLAESSIFSKAIPNLLKTKLPVSKEKSVRLTGQLAHLNSIKSLVLAGVNLGHKSLKDRSACNSSVSMFLSGNRNNSAILKTNLMLSYFLRAIHILTLIIKAGGNVLIINTNPEFSILLKHIRKTTNSSQIFYSDCYWVGGTLTNWAQVSKSINTFITFYDKFDDFLIKNQINFTDYKKMRKQFKGFIIKRKAVKSNLVSEFNSAVNQPKKVTGLVDRLTTKGSLLATTPLLQVSNINSVNISLPGGVKNRQTKTLFDKNWKPDLIFILNSTGTEAIVREAFILQIPVISLVDSNTEISNITYPIPTNKDCFGFARFCLNYILKIASKNEKQKS